jgi:hypothetical protein
VSQPQQQPQPQSQRSWQETIRVQGDKAVEQVKRLIHEGNIRRVVVKQGDRTIAEFPLTVGVLGAAIAPPLAAIGALAALLTDCQVELEKVVEGEQPIDAEATETEPAAVPEAALPPTTADEAPPV